MLLVDLNEFQLFNRDGQSGAENAAELLKIISLKWKFCGLAIDRPILDALKFNYMQKTYNKII